MSDNAVFVTRLLRIILTARSVEVCSEQAVALFDGYQRQLYRELSIDPAARPTTSAKMLADCALNDLRQRILKVEIETPEPWRTILTTTRRRVDMSRRVLATHIAEDDVAMAPLIGAYEWPAAPAEAAGAPAHRTPQQIPRPGVIHQLLPDVARHGGARPAREDHRWPTLSPISSC